MAQVAIGLVNGAFYAMLSLGLAVIFGMLNVINFTHGAQFMMGAFAAWLLLGLLDVPFWASLVLAPVIVQRIGEIIRQLKGRGFTILLVEQNFHFAATVADRHYVMEDGRVVDMIASADVQQNIGKLQAYLGV